MGRQKTVSMGIFQQLNNTYSFIVSIIIEKMSCLEDPEDEKLLTNCYLKHMSQCEASVKMHHHKTWAYRRLDQALKNLDVILLDLKEEDMIPLPEAG